MDPSHRAGGAVNAADTIFCSAAQHAAHGAMGGATAFAVGTVNTHYVEILPDFANRRRLAVTGAFLAISRGRRASPSFDNDADASCDDAPRVADGRLRCHVDGPSIRVNHAL